MGAHLAVRLQSRLLSANLPPKVPVMIALNVRTAKERQIDCQLGDLAGTITAQQGRNPAVMLVDVESLPSGTKAGPSAKAAALVPHEIDADRWPVDTPWA